MRSTRPESSGMKTVADIADVLNVSVRGDGSRGIRGVASLEDATSEQLSFLSSEQYRRAFLTTRAAAVIVDRKVRLPDNVSTSDGAPALLIVDHADLAVARVLALFALPVPRPP